jgi:D-alanyl-D-alanine carboxypeptidase
VANTNRRFLDAYEGADGIKTGYTSAAGFNLVASAERGRERIIATVFGGSSTANRNARMAELLDFGFDRAPTRVAVNRPQLPRYDAVPDDDAPAAALVAEAGSVPEGMSTKIVRVSGAIAQSPRPRPRGGAAADEPPVELLAAIEANVADAIAAAAAEAAAQSVSESVAAGVASEVALALAETSVAAEPEAEAPAMAGPPARPEDLVPATDEVEVSAADLAAETIEPATDEAAADAAAAPEVPADETEILVAEAVTEEAAPGAGAPEALSLVADVAPAPGAEPDLDLVSIRPADILGPELAAGALPDFAPAPEPEAVLLAAAVAPPLPPEPTIRPEPVSAEIVTRLSTSGGRHYGVSLGRFGTRTEAEKALITMSLSDMAGLGGALRRVVQRSGGFEANFMGMSEEEAALACRRMLARGLDCAPIGG